ncbi:MAG TPA: sulfatase-like hydrolase/transferase, partial [Vicinamibacteria bacterium]|nr:sulfatase-like hydrolase/transferase [Vicinamibacteria bacterium]
MARRRKNKKSPAKPIAETRAPELPPVTRRRLRLLWLVPPLVVAAIVVMVLHPAEITPRKLNVIIVTADTLRADKLGAYGNTAVETPHIDRIGSEGIVFEQAVTAAPVTLPSHASIFTGTYPPAHGVRDNGGAALSSDRTTLAEVLRSEGYATGAFIGAFVLSSRWGLDQGFDQYDDDIDTAGSHNLGGSDAQRRGDTVLADAFRWMDSVKERAFFSWIHLFDPHMPYDAPDPFRSRYENPYDGEVAYVDSLVGELLEWVDTNELGESTLIAFVGDHGESLGEHGELTHGFFVYDATMRVPLVVRTPYRALQSRRVSSLVRTIDLMPTVLDLVGLETPQGVQGQSLVELALGRPPSDTPHAYGESLFPSHYGWSPLRSLRDEEFLFVDAPRPELYDLRADPTQQTNLGSARADAVQSYREKLRNLESEMGGFDTTSSTSATLDPETASRLTALGYVGAGSFRSVDSSSASDPKDKIDLFNRIRGAATAADAGRLDDAITFLDSVLEEDPGVVEARNMLAGYLARRGDLRAAETAYREALSRGPDYAPAILGLASVQLEMGRRQDAEITLSRMLELEPGNPPGSFLLARIFIDSGRF